MSQPTTGGGPAASPPDPAPKHDVRAVLRLTAFRRLWLSLGLSSLGDWLGLLAATAMAASLGAQNSYAAANLAVSGVLILRLAPAVLFGPVAGAFADRFDRKVTMVVGDVLRFVLFASIPLIGTLWWLFVATVLIEIIGLFWMPAKDATVPNLVPRERLEAANQLSLATTYGSAPVAALLFALLSLGAGVLNRFAPWIGGPADLAMYVNALTNLVAAAVILRIDMPRRPGVNAGPSGAVATTTAVAPTAGGPDPVTGPPSVRPSTGMWRSIVDGWAYVARHRLIRGLVIGMLGAFGAGGFVIGVAPTFSADLGAGAAAYGMLFAAVFTGLAAGMWIGPRLLPDFTRWRLFALSLMMAGVWLCCLAIFPNSVMAFFFTLLLGSAAGVAWVTGYTLLGLEVGDEMRGRTFAFVQNGARIVLIAVMALAPGMAALLGERSVTYGETTLNYNGAAITLLIAGLLALLIGMLSYRMMNDQPATGLLADLTHAWRVRPGADMPAPAQHKGLFIAFEGGDGAGKTSQIKLLSAWLRVDLRREVVTTREPGATDLGSTIRQLVLHTDDDIDPHTEALLFAADRAQHVHSLIRPALDRGAVVLTDRYLDSSIAYQGGGRGFDPSGIERISTWATGNLLPDLTVLLDIDPAVARRRIAATGASLDRLEGEGLAFHQRVREMFLARAKRAPRRYLVLDATRDPLELNQQIRDRLRPSLIEDAAASGSDAQPTRTVSAASEVAAAGSAGTPSGGSVDVRETPGHRDTPSGHRMSRPSAPTPTAGRPDEVAARTPGADPSEDAERDPWDPR